MKQLQSCELKDTVAASDLKQTVTKEQFQRLERWAKSKPRFALMGEFSAGKSTLLNFLTGLDVVPTQTTATHLPAVWLKHGDKRHGEAFGADGSVTPVDGNDLKPDMLNDKTLIRLQIPSRMLAEFEVIDTPGISDPNMSAKNLPRIAGLCNFVIWCTHATQAWRQSERAAWTALPKRLRENSILVVTRADKLKTEEEFVKVRRRLKREVEGLFKDIVFLSTPDAVDARERMYEPDGEERWTQSGGAAFEAALNSSVVQTSDARLALLSRYEIGDAALPEKPVDITKKVAASTAETVDPQALWDAVLAEVGPIMSETQVKAAVDHFLDKLNMFSHGQRLVKHYSYGLFAPAREDTMNTEKALNQIRCEIGYFSQDPRRSLLSAGGEGSCHSEE